MSCPIFIRATRALFQRFDDEISLKKQHCDNRLTLSERVLVRWWRLVAFMKATNLLHRAMRAVYYRRIAITIEMAIKVGIFCIIAVLIVALAATGAIRGE
jgi:hypothetical protein